MLLLVMTWPFWILALGSLALLWMVAVEAPVGAALVLAAVLGLLQWLGGFQIWQWVQANPSTVLLGLAIYLPIGISWSFFKWYLYVVDKHAKFLSDEEILKKNERHSSFTFEQRLEASKPNARDNKDKIINWMAYWPVSAVWTLLHDFVEKLAHAIFRHLSGIYQKISDKVYQKS